MVHTSLTDSLSQVPSQSRDDEPFRFLDLPSELRLMVYEEIKADTRHYRLKDPVFEARSHGMPASYITLVTQNLPVVLLATCHLINEEAKPIFAPKLAALRNEPAQYIVDSASFDTSTEEELSLFDLIRETEGEHPPSPTDKIFIGEYWENCSTDGHFVPGDAGHHVIKEFVNKCVSYRALRPTQSTVMSIRRHPAKSNIYPGHLSHATWLVGSGWDNLNFLMHGFEDESVDVASSDVQFEQARGYDCQTWQVEVGSPAYWKKAWDDVEDVVVFG
jgi:hypothetical protein